MWARVFHVPHPQLLAHVVLLRALEWTPLLTSTERAGTGPGVPRCQRPRYSQRDPALCDHTLSLTPFFPGHTLLTPSLPLTPALRGHTHLDHTLPDHAPDHTLPPSHWISLGPGGWGKVCRRTVPLGSGGREGSWQEVGWGSGHGTGDWKTWGAEEGCQSSSQSRLGLRESVQGSSTCAALPQCLALLCTPQAPRTVPPSWLCAELFPGGPQPFVGY